MSSLASVSSSKKPRIEAEASAWSFTATKDTVFSFAWTIDQFRRKMKTYNPGEKVESGIFKVMVDGVETSWKLSCYPNGKKGNYSGFVGMYLLSTEEAPKTFNGRLNFSLELISKENRRMFRKTTDKSGEDNWALGWGWEKYVTHESLKSCESYLLPQDCFEVICVMKFDGKEETTSGVSTSTNLPLEPNEEVKGEACSGLVDLLETGMFADVELMCEERTFSCHKAILARKSPVFMATLSNNMKEKATGHVKIEGIDPDIFKDMLTYVYGGKIEKLEDKADDLLVAADRYDLKQLKKSCEEMLSRSLNVGNCLSCVVLADRHSSDSLKPVVIKFIIENFLEVVALDNWMESLTNFPELFQEVFNELASLRSSKQKTKNYEK